MWVCIKTCDLDYQEKRQLYVIVIIRARNDATAIQKGKGGFLPL